MVGDGEVVHEARGEITLVQEDRFRLQTDDGRSLLLILGANSSLKRLDELAGSREQVAVRYRGDPDEGAVAFDIQPV